MDIAQKALYNSLRMSWLQGQESPPEEIIEPWKVEDYRLLSLDDLFKRLQQKEIVLDRALFKSYADQFDSPEELTMWLLDGEELSPEDYDQIYLVAFELWRKLLPEKPSISVICDELDYQISCYDQGDKSNLEPLQDALSSFYTILQENVDEGMDPQQIYSALSEFCANDLDHFLYDYISDQIDEHLNDYATELLDQFYSYIVEKKWFDLLRARLIAIQDAHKGNELLRQIFEQSKNAPALDFYLDILTSMVQEGNRELFAKIATATCDLVEQEEDFVELLSVCSDFYGCLDKDDIQLEIDSRIQKRAKENHFGPLSPSDSDLIWLKELFKNNA
jgi:hypothetical protein